MRRRGEREKLDAGKSYPISPPVPGGGVQWPGEALKGNWCHPQVALSLSVLACTAALHCAVDEGLAAALPRALL